MSNPQAEVELVAAAEAEAEAIAEMAARIWPSAYGEILPPGQIDYMLSWMYEPGRLRSDMAAGVEFLWIVAAGGRAGFLGFGPVVSGAACPLHKCYLLPERQGGGVGSLALELLCERLARCGASSVELRVNRHNRRAIAFYQRNGLSIRGEDRLDIGGGYVMDDYLMGRDLGG